MSKANFSSTSCLIDREELSNKADELYTITSNGLNRPRSLSSNTILDEQASKLNFTSVSCLLTHNDLADKADELYSITWNGINRPLI